MSFELDPISSASTISHGEFSTSQSQPKILSRTSLARIHDPEHAFMHQRMSRSEERLDNKINVGFSRKCLINNTKYISNESLS